MQKAAAKPRLVNHSAEWTAAESAELYGIRNWGAGYFDINEAGNVTVSVPIDGARVSASLTDLIAGMQQRGLQMPALLRLDNLLEAQIALLNESFGKAIQTLGYKAEYHGVFPIKVNQQCAVIEEIARVGARYGHGLECGSKAELLIALAYLEPDKGYIICNGYKDEEFVDLALQSLRLGFKCFFVLETPTELPLILEASKRLDVRPMLGIRVKLAAKVEGHWNESSGDRSIFGLTTAQLVELVDALREHGLLDCLQLLHYHLGSQIPNIRDIRGGVLEACRYYVSLKQEGASMGYLDLGGGLGVDYDGSQTNSNYSKNYSLDEYSSDVIETIMTALAGTDVAHPVLITESGRATVAYSSILLFNILDVTSYEPGGAAPVVPEDEHELVKNLLEVLKGVSIKAAKECYNDAIFYREEIRDLFRRGQIRLRSLSLAENIFLHIVWGILADITCDSDGKIDRFIESGGLRRTLPVHPLVEGQPYYFGVFLVGAYQETLGDLHNLMGDTNVASVRIQADGSFEFAREMSGDSIADVLSYVEYQPQKLLEQLRRTAELAVRNERITLAQRQTLLESFSASLRGYTYYED